MAEHHNREFQRYMTTTSEQLAKFWAGLLRTSFGQRLLVVHPSLRELTIDDFAVTVPLTIHGDAAPYGKRRSALFVQWGSLLGVHVTLSIRHFDPRAIASISTWVRENRYEVSSPECYWCLRNKHHRNPENL